MVLLRILFIFISLIIIPAARSDDSAAMQKLASALSPTPSGWTGSGYCDWSGVGCDNSNQVTSINLAKKSLSGTLPSELSTLGHLQTLALQGNTLSGPIPSLGGISTLQSVYLDGNNFTSVPDGFFRGLTGLTYFSIGTNPGLASWSIPSDLTESAGLASFLASDANIIGSIPDIFASFPSLTDLRLSYNNLTGGLPESLGSSGIQSLWLNNQQQGLSGSIDVLSSMRQLKQVWLQKNAFTGPIPDLSKCDILFDLQLRDNQFSGVVPHSSLTSLPGLLNISLSNNKLQGPKPSFPDTVNVDDTGVNHFCLNTTGTPCDPQVTTLLEIAAGFGYPAKLADAWDGNDACNSWLFINCDTQNRIITVNFAKQNFGGVISPAFGNLTYLKTLYLSDNNLTGTIPAGLANLTQLQTLDVSNNNLSGKIPAFPSTLKLSTAGNPLLGTEIVNPGGGGGSGTGSNSSTTPGRTSSGSGSGGLSVGVIAAVVVVVVIFIAIILFVVFKFRAKKRRAMSGKVKDPEAGSGSVANAAANCFTKGNGYGPLSEVQSHDSGNRSDHHFLEGGNVVIPVEVLRQVTDNFSDHNIIGKGGFGVVYKGELHDGTKIAIKRMEASQIGTRAGNEFQAEIGVLTKVRHRHLVALLGYCIDGIERLLVYEYMPQGTLAQHLFEWRDHRWPPLSWTQRVTIALDVARGVEYLHSLAQQSFIHRDLKPSNILLGDDMRAKVADFGLVKLAPDGKYSLETRLAGTFGYLAPEYAATGRVTMKVDVYAFGVILMEIITGRKALDETQPDERAHLVACFRRVLINKENIVKEIDQTLNPDEETLASIYKVAELAGHCTAREPYQRPDMGHAVNILGPLVEQWRPASQEDEDASGIDLQMSLPERLQRWQANEGTSTMLNDMSYCNTHTSIPDGMANTFTSTDCR